MHKRIQGYLTPPIVIGVVVIAAVIAVGVTYVIASARPSGSFAMPTMGPLVQDVDTTGSVAAANTINLGFQVSGTVSDAGPAVGTQVSAGETLGALSSATQQAAVEQAQAALEAQQANLSALQAGATPQALAVSQTSVANAQASLSQAQQSLLAVAQDAYAKSYAAVDNDVDEFVVNPHTSNPTLAFNLTSSQDQASIVAGRLQMETLLNTWQAYLTDLSGNPSQIDDASLASTTRNNLEQIGSFLTLAATGLTEVVPSTNYTTATIQTYQSNVNTGRTNVSTDLTSVDSAAAALTTAESSLASAQSQLNLAEAPATSQALEAQEAQVAAAQASVDAAKAQLGQTIISAPIAGIITVNNMEPGQIATAGQTQISMVSNTAFQFDTYVSEADLADIQVGDQGEVKLDAYQDEAPLSAHVIEINPAATVVDGVSSYEIKLQFDVNDPRISSGETGSVDIVTQSLQNVMSVPTSAIIMDNGQYFVVEKTSSGTREVPVQIGIQSSSGYTQITSGLSADAEVQTFGNQ